MKAALAFEIVSVADEAEAICTRIHDGSQTMPATSSNPLDPAAFAQLARELLGEPTETSDTELRFGTNGSMSVDLAKGTWYSHEINKGGGQFDLVTHTLRLDEQERLDWLRSRGYLNGSHPQKGGTAPPKPKLKPKGKFVKAYPYRDENGVLLFEVCRFEEPKDFRQRKPDGKGGYISSVKGVRRVPYRLDELKDRLDNVIVIPEGEKDCDRLWKLGIPATTNAGGAGKWRDDLTPFFKGADVVIVPDNDEAGRNHAADVAIRLAKVAKRIRILELWHDWPQMPEKADISDWFDKGGGTVERLRELIEACPDWSPAQDDKPQPEPSEPKPETADDIIARLAKMSQLEYARVRKETATRLKISLPDLNKLVQAKREKDEADERKVVHLKIAEAKLAAGEPEWRETNKDGSPKPSLENARLAITSVGVACNLDTFHNKMLTECANDKCRHALETVLGEVSDNSIMGLRQFLSHRFGFDLTEKHVRDGVVSLALDHCFDPVADMLDEAEAAWIKDGRKPRLDRMASEHLSCEDTPLNSVCIRKTMIAGVARVRTPGIKFDNIPILEAKEGWNKSTAWRVLAGSDDNFSDESIMGKNSREVQEQLATCWIHENAELAGMKKAELETIKAFASRQTDRARPAYGHFMKQQPRHNIEVGTTNNSEYLQSQNGNRRFWPMMLTKAIDIEKLKKDRLLLWGEAAHHQREGECLTIPEAMWPIAEVEQEKRRTKHPWEDLLADLPMTVENTKWSDKEERFITVGPRIPVVVIERGKELVASAVLLTHVLKIVEGQQGPQHAMRLAEVMQKLKWQRDPDGNKITIGGKQVRGYFRDLPQQPTKPVKK